MKKSNMKNLVLATAFGITIGGFNISQVIAKNLSELPVTQKIEYVFNNYNLNENEKEAQIEVLQINGLKSKELETQLNSTFMKQAQNLYDSFSSTSDTANYVNLDYTIKSDNNSVLSIVEVHSETSASSQAGITSYVVDKQNQKLVKLSDLFKDNSYITAISDNIKSQMRNQMKADEGVIYNIDNTYIPEDNFDKIKENQNFYINDKNQLVIVFNDYEVAPGYMGAPEFIIPVNAIENILADTVNIFIQ